MGWDLTRFISHADTHSCAAHEVRGQGITMEPLSDPVGVPLKPSPPRDLLLLEPAHDDVAGQGPGRALPNPTARRDRASAGRGNKDTINIHLPSHIYKSHSCKMVSVTSVQYNSPNNFKSLKFVKITLCFYGNHTGVIFIFAVAP